MKLGEKIKLLRSENKWTMQELADRASLTKGYISMLEKGVNPSTKKEIIPSLETVQNIANAFTIDLETLLKDTHSNISLSKDTETQKNTLNGAIESIVTTSTQLEEKRQENVLTYAKQQLAEQQKEQAKKSNVIEFNKADEINEELYPYNVTEKSAAARDIAHGYSYNPDHNETFTVYSDYKTRHHYDIATQVVGDSMEPKYPDGDIVLIQKGYDNWNGGVYVVDYDGMTYLKKVFLEDNQFRLVSINPKYEDIIIDIPVDEDIYFNIVGRVVDSFTPVER